MRREEFCPERFCLEQRAPQGDSLPLMSWWEVVGWLGSAILVLSLLQTVIWRLRLINLAGCLVLIGYNTVVGVWPMVGLNIVLAGINIVYLFRMAKSRHAAEHYDVVQVTRDDAYLRHLLQRHRRDIARFNPLFDVSTDTDEAYLIAQGDELVGVVLADIDDGVARVRLDYVTPRFRDLSPGEFVFGPQGAFAGRDIRRVVTPPGMLRPYYEKLGFRRERESYVLEYARD